MTSWDVLRARSLQGTEDKEDGHSEGRRSKRELTDEQRRAIEQAEFDAMLEAERKIASGS